MPATHARILIAGGGPIGLALAADLGLRGVRTLLVEQNEDKLGSAKMIQVSIRTMEYCRQRPACYRAAMESLRNYRRLVVRTSHPKIAEPSPEGERTRAELGHRLVDENEKSWHPIGVHLGYLYFPSPIIVDDGSPVPSADTVSYVPSARPGVRAPHAWLEEDRSTLDLFGPGFTLLVLGEADTRGLEQAAASRRLPPAVRQVRSTEAAALYERNLVLVRPDGHVAWRRDTPRDDPLRVIDTVRGAGPRIAARRLRDSARS